MTRDDWPHLLAAYTQEEDGGMSENDGPLIQALTRAVLALYDEPDPQWSDSLYEVADRLNRLADERRRNAT